MSRVGFLIIGVQKAGTTALDHYLRQHPQVCMGNEKELHFFDDETKFINENSVAYEEYHSNFSPNSKTKITGEATPIYIYWDDSIKRIWRYNRQIKIIILLRNPIYRAYSHWNMERSRNQEKENFLQAIMMETQRAKKELPYKDRVFSYIDRGYYSEQIRRVFRFFSEDQVLILKNDELKENLQNSLCRVSSFLNISSFNKPIPKEIHSRGYQRNLSLKEFNILRKIYYYDIKSLENMLNWNCSSWLRKEEKIKVLFYRDFKSYTGGHQKVYDYYTHLKSHEMFDVDILFSKETVWDETNPWYGKNYNKIEDVNIKELKKG